MAISAAFVILLGNAYATQRQIEIHQLQTTLLQEQSSYASQVASLTDASAPAKIAARAGDLHLVVPMSVVQIPSASLDTPLPLPSLSAPYVAISRIYK